LNRERWPALRARLDRLARGLCLVEGGEPIGD
jgi:hypothetical protein